MSGKKMGLEGKYKNFYKSIGTLPAASGNKNTLSINPMQDDFNKSMGMGTTGAFLTRRAILGAGSKNASTLLEKAGKSSVKEKIKKALTSKTNIGATAGAAGYEIGKAEGKRYGGKVMKASSGKAVSLKEVYALANRNKSEDRLTDADIKNAKKVLGYKEALPEIKADGAKYGKFMKKEKKIKKVMGEYKKGELNIGKSKKKVKSRKQAIAIALSEARKKKA